MQQKERVQIVWLGKEEVAFKLSPESYERSNHRKSQGKALQKEGADI